MFRGRHNLNNLMDQNARYWVNVGRILAFDWYMKQCFIFRLFQIRTFKLEGLVPAVFTPMKTDG